MVSRNKLLFQQAQHYIPSGVNSPVRAFQAVGGTPLFIQKAQGPWIWDEDGRKYLDFCASWGPMILGHAPSALVRTLGRALRNGASYGAPTDLEVRLAQNISKIYSGMEKIRLTSSGTEAVMSSLRLARGFTGRKKILKIEGGYHGHVDSLLVKAGSGGATFGVPDSAGIPDELSRLTLTVPFNQEEILQEVFRKQGRNIAAVIIEPVPANMGVVLPKPGYLQAVRRITETYGTLLIFDEVITGFRLGLSGAQGVYGVCPDMTCLGKILGGGFPMAAFGGKSEIMDHLAPAGPVYQAGTLSGNPVAVSAALWMIQSLERRGLYQNLNRSAEVFFEELRKVIRDRKYPVCLNTAGSMFTLFFTSGPVTHYASAKTADTKQYAAFFHACLKKGIYLAPSQFEANFISTEHTPALLKKAAQGLLASLRSIL